MMTSEATPEPVFAFVCNGQCHAKKMVVDDIMNVRVWKMAAVRIQGYPDSI